MPQDSECIESDALGEGLTALDWASLYISISRWAVERASVQFLHTIHPYCTRHVTGPSTSLTHMNPETAWSHKYSGVKIGV
jgi:hypothetical protein